MKTKAYRSPGSKRKRAAAELTRVVHSKTIEEIARERCAKPFDAQAFAGVVPPGEDIGAFVKEIYQARS